MLRDPARPLVPPSETGIRAIQAASFHQTEGSVLIKIFKVIIVKLFSSALTRLSSNNWANIRVVDVPKK
jgi:hypothetical protein